MDRETDRGLGESFAKWFLIKQHVRVSADAKYMELTLTSSKRDQFRKGITLTIAASSDPACPVKAMRLLQARDQHRPLTAPLLCVRRLNLQAFTSQHVVRSRQQLAITAGLGNGSWNGHSFRRGAATWAAQVGNPEAEIEILERWPSDAYKAYIEFSRDEQISLSKPFQQPQSQST